MYLVIAYLYILYSQQIDSRCVYVGLSVIKESAGRCQKCQMSIKRMIHFVEIFFNKNGII